MEVFYLKINQNNAVTWRYLKMWLNIVQQFPDAKTYIVCDNPRLQAFIAAQNQNGLYTYEFITSAKNSGELQYIVDNAIPKNFHNPAYAHLTTCLHARDNGFKSFWNIDADDMGLYAKPRKIAKLFKIVKDYATAHGINCFSLDAAGKTFSSGKVWNFGISYTDNSINWLDILKDHCTDTETEEHFKNFGDVKTIDWFFNYLRAIQAAQIETFYVENLYMTHHNLSEYDIPLWGVRYWSGGKCHWTLLIEDFGMGDAGSLNIPQDVIKFDIGLTKTECRRCFKERAQIQSILRSFEIAGKMTDSEITAILPLDGTAKNIAPCLEGLLNQDFGIENLSFEFKFADKNFFSAFRLIVTDAGLDEEALNTCREMERKFGGRMKIITGLAESDLFSAGLKAAKGHYVMFINGNDIFVSNALQTLHEIAEFVRADVVHLSNYLVKNSEETFSVETNESGWGENLQAINILQRFNDKFGAWRSGSLAPSIYGKFIRREFLEEEQIALPRDNEIAQWLFSLQCLLLAETYARAPQPLYVRTVKNGTRKIDFQDIDATAKSICEGTNILKRLDAEVFYFEEYAQAKDALNSLYKNLIRECLNEALLKVSSSTRR